jgi:hypothetical protein
LWPPRDEQLHHRLLLPLVFCLTSDLKKQTQPVKHWNHDPKLIFPLFKLFPSWIC